MSQIDDNSDSSDNARDGRQKKQVEGVHYNDEALKLNQIQG